MSDSINPARLLELVTKGKTLYTAMQSAANDGVTDKPMPELSPNYRIDVTSIETTVQTHGILLNLLKMNGTPIDGYMGVDAVSVDPEGYSVGEAAYSNCLHASGRALLCFWNFASWDRLNGKPGRLYWSDLMAAGCAHAMKAHSNLALLESIWRVHVINPDTLGVCKNIAAQLGEAKDQPFVLRPDSDHFFALLGTHHGKGPARMLTDYPRMFGYRTIEKATCFFVDKKLYISWSLQAAARKLPQGVSDSPLSRKQRRHLKKLTRSSSGGLAGSEPVA